MLYIIRGIPGSGKSTLAREMLAENAIDVYYEADMYFEQEGEYKYDKSKIQKAHKWCLYNTCLALELGYKVAVANTFTRKWEYKFYVDYAKLLSIPYVVIICKGEFTSIHNVPKATVDKMRERFEK